MTARAAWGWGLACVHSSGQVLDTWFAAPALGAYDGREAPLMLPVTTDARRQTHAAPLTASKYRDAPRANRPTPNPRPHHDRQGPHQARSHLC